MATNDIKFKVIATADGFDIVQKKQKGLADQIDKTTTSTKNLDKTQEKNYGRQKQGVIQTANSTKNFSKLNQTIGSGSSGLVGAYATLAANVFAATAAFNALRQAAAFQQLAEGFTFMANESGRTTSLVVDRLKEITGQAISTQEALQGASLALSAGFETSQLETLAKVARGASLALGRNLNDAFDRLTRGAIKLEPEILDELGIMVRLDDAVEQYAASLGKSVKSLTQFERQQAFLNAINEQGIEKYGAIAEAIDVNPFDRLAAAFEDLTKRGLNLVNKVLLPFVELFAGSSAVMTGGLVLFGSTILTQMIPALGQMSQRSADAAAGFKDIADRAKEGADETVVAARQSILAIEKPSKSIRKVQGVLKKGNLEEINIKKELVLANKRLTTAEKTAQEGKTASARKNAAARITLIEQEIEALERLQMAGAQQVSAIGQLGGAERDFDVADREAQGLQAISLKGPIAGFKEANKQFKDFRTNADLSGQKLKYLGFVFPRAGKAAKLASVGVKFFGSALLNAIPFIGQAIFLIGIFSTAFTKIKEKIFPTNQGLLNLREILETLPEKFDQLNDRMNEGASVADMNIRRYKVTAGILQELATEYTALANAAELAAEKQIKELEARGVLDRMSEGQRAQLQEGLQTRFEGQNTEAAQESLKEIFAQEDKQSELLKEEIRKASAGFRTGFRITAKGETKLTADEIARILNIAKERVSEIDVQFTSLKKQLNDSERVYSKFFDKFTVKTEFDDLVTTFTSMGETIANLGKKGKEAEVKEILEELGTGAKKFGITADNARKTIPKLAEAFERIRAKTVTLKEELAEIDTRLGVLKKFEKFSGDATAAAIDLGNERIQKQKDLNDAQLVELRAMTQTDEVKLRISQLETENLNLQTQKVGEVLKEQMVAEANLKVRQQESNILAKNLKFQQDQERLRAKAQSLSAGRQETPAEKFNTEVEIIKQQNKADKVRLKIEKEIIQARFNVIAAEMHAAKVRGDISQEVYNSAIISQAKLASLSMSGIDDQITAIDEGLNLQSKLGEGVLSGDLDTAFSALDKLDAPTIAQKFEVMKTSLDPFIESLKELGASGEFAASLATVMTTLGDSFIGFGDRTDQLVKSFADDPAFKENGFFGKMGISAEKAAGTIATLEGVSSVLNGFGQAIQAQANQRLEAVDRAIEKEKKMDGKSKESVARIKQMEKKKEQIQRKAFEDNKKIQIATTIINTASAIVRTLAELGPIAGPILATAIGALGMAQLAIIRKSTFNGGGGGEDGARTTSLNIGGQRNNTVDVGRSATAGELSYLRGERGVGTNANNFTPGGAMGRKGYANGGDGIVVGERGPEIISPSSPVDITPNYAMGNGTTNVNFNISAIDGASVQNMLNEQQGNIIAMIRQAANDNGEGFLETVDPTVYGGSG